MSWRRLARQEHAGDFSLGAYSAIERVCEELATSLMYARQRLDFPEIRRLRMQYRNLLRDIRLLGGAAATLPLFLQSLSPTVRYWTLIGLQQEASPMYDELPGPKQWNISREGFAKIKYRQWDSKKRKWNWKNTTGSTAASKLKRRQLNDARYGVGGWRYV